MTTKEEVFFFTYHCPLNCMTDPSTSHIAIKPLAEKKESLLLEELTFPQHLWRRKKKKRRSMIRSAIYSV
jgi:hypothetical protein